MFILSPKCILSAYICLKYKAIYLAVRNKCIIFAKSTKKEIVLRKKILLLPIVVLLCIFGATAQQRGKATYYSHRLHGVRMSDGSRYHRDSMTCAHKTYPMGTILKVHNLSNDKEVYVKVTDRGPYGKGKIIDLSYAAAREIGMIGAGIANVEVEEATATPPYMIPENNLLQLRLRDPVSGKYYSYSEYQKLNEKRLAAKTERVAKATVKRPVPRYRIMQGSLSARSK